MLELLLAVVLGIGFVILLVALPVMLLVGVVKALVWLVLLPFKVLGLALHGLAAVLVALLKGAGLLLSIVLGLLLIVLALVALPLIPLLVIGFGIWLLARLFAPSAALQPSR